MTFPENPSRSFGDLFPEDLDAISPNDLILSHYPGGEADKYFVRGYPQLLVRHHEGGYPIDHLRQTALVFNELPRYGINALPYVPAEIGGEPCIVTLRVTGDPLEDILKSGADSEMITRIDTLWSNLVTYMRERKQNHQPCARDIYTPAQYMFGTIANEDKKELWLVDLGEHAEAFSDRPGYYGYEGLVLRVTNTVLSLEKSLGPHLPESRSALEQALSSVILPPVAEAGRTALQNDTLIDLEQARLLF